MILAEKIMELRKKNGWSQEGLPSRFTCRDSLYRSGRAALRFRI